MSRSSVFQTPCSARNPTEEIKSCGEKCANLCRVYKLIMVSRVLGYGHPEYLVLELSCWSHHSKLIWLGLMMMLNWDWVGWTFSMFNNHQDSLIKFIPLLYGQIGFSQNCNHRAFHQPYMHVVIALFCSLLSMCYMPAYSMCWPVFGLQSSCCRIFRRRVRCLRSWSFTQWCRCSWWTHFIFQAFHCYRI